LPNSACDFMLTLQQVPHQLPQRQQQASLALLHFVESTVSIRTKETIEVVTKLKLSKSGLSILKGAWQ
jgi:hypothetical protein